MNVRVRSGTRTVRLSLAALADVREPRRRPRHRRFGGQTALLLVVLPAALACARRVAPATPQTAEPCAPCRIEVRNSTGYRIDLRVDGVNGTVLGVVEPRGVVEFTVAEAPRSVVGMRSDSTQPSGRSCEFLGVRDSVRRYECRGR